MGATIRQERNGIWVMQISGALSKEELDAVQAAVIKALGANEEVKLLVMIAEDFAGWVGGEIWGDTTFFVEHGDRIVKIAIVGDSKWETEVLMFTGAGLRRAPVRYFTRNQLPEAHAWLS